MNWGAVFRMCEPLNVFPSIAITSCSVSFFTAFTQLEKHSSNANESNAANILPNVAFDGVPLDRLTSAWYLSHF